MRAFGISYSFWMPEPDKLNVLQVNGGYHTQFKFSNGVIKSGPLVLWAHVCLQ